MSEVAPSGYAPIESGEWAGWHVWRGDPFEDANGPFHVRFDSSGRGECAFRAEPRHMNGGGFMHGGCLMTFADAALFAIARPEIGDQRAVTMNLSSDFLSAVNVGQLVTATGEVTRGGGKTIFVRGMVSADGTPALSFSGIIRKLGQR